MSSRRKLKKSIKETMGLLYVDCLFYKMFVVDADKDAADKVLLKIIEQEDELIKRVSVNEGKDVKGRVKAYFQKLRNEVKEQANIIAGEIAALGK